MSVLALCLAATLCTPRLLLAQNLDAADVRVTLDSALRLAQTAARQAFPDLQRYLLYSVTPRVFLGDSRGLHWQVLWQERDQPRRLRLAVRVYMRDGYAMAERLE
jgi:hypothetical protein